MNIKQTSKKAKVFIFISRMSPFELSYGLLVGCENVYRTITSG